MEHGSDEVWATAGRQVRYSELRAETSWLADMFEVHGVRPGSTVALHGSPSFTQLWSVLALWSIGAQIILCEPGTSPAGVDQILRQSTPQFLVSFRGPRRRPDAFVDQCELLVRRLPGGRPARSSHSVVQFSSGTTGRPKAIGRTSESLLTELDRLHALDGMPRAVERVAVLESVVHSFGLIAGLLHALAARAVLVLPTGGDDRALAAAAAAAHVVFGNPWHFRRLADTDQPLRLPRLRLAVSGGDLLPEQVASRFQRRYGVAIGQAYGTTETGIVATDLAGEHGPRAIGRPVPGVRTRVVGGVLEVSVPQSPYLYQDRPWLGGWMSTFDLVSRDPGGVLRLRGRVGDLVHTDVSPLDIEAVLCAHELVTDAVVLTAHPFEAHVASPADLGQAELRSWCRRFLGEEMIPARYHVVRDLPRTSNGKVVRHRAALHEHRRAFRPAAAERSGSHG